MTRTRLSHALVVVMFALICSAALGATREQADKFLAGHRYKEAEAAYRELAQAATGLEQAELNRQLGMTLLRQYKAADAIVAFKLTIDSPDATDEMRATSWLHSGTCYHHLKKYNEAIACYDAVEKIADVAPETLVSARVRRGFAWGNLKEPDNAVKAFESMLEVKDANPFWHQMAMVHAGSTLQKQRRYEEAAGYFRRALTFGENGHAANQARNHLAECVAAVGAEPGFYIAPYVSLVSSTEATIFWMSNLDIAAGTVSLNGGEKKATASLKKMVDRDRNRQSVTFDDLKPYTLYQYTVSCNGKEMTGAFHTARDTPGPIRFVVIGDTQGGPQYHSKLAPHIAADNPDFVLHVGDCVEIGEHWDEWKIQMFDPGLPYLSKAPFWVARGNHDGGPYFSVIFGREKAPWQTFTFGDLQVYVLDSTYYMGKTSGDKQLAWLADQLANSTSKWKALGMHHSLFHTTSGDLLVGQDNFRPLVEKESPDLVFNGHYHKYSRQIPFGEKGQKPIINIVTGGGGGGNGTPSTNSPLVAASYESFHYTFVEIDGDTCNITAKDIDGKAFDHYTLIKSGDGFQAEVMEKAVSSETARSIRRIYADLKFPHYNRLDLTGQWTNGSVILDKNILDVTKLQKGTHLIIEATDDTAWTVARQSLDLSAGELTFKATAPEDEKAPLRVTLNVEFEGQLFEPWATSVTLRKP